MKKLELKNKTVSKNTIAENLVNELREKLKQHIAILVRRLYEKFGWADPDFSEKEDWVIPTGDLVGKIYINVEVDDSYLDVEERCYEDIEIAEVRVGLDGDTIVTNEDGDEWYSADLSTDELAHIAKVLEKTYWKFSE